MGSVKLRSGPVVPISVRLHDKGPQLFETNQFGTNEFIQFCKLTGAQPYLAANLRSLPALEFDHWVEYCTLLPEAQPWPRCARPPVFQNRSMSATPGGKT
jgi:hypothetical protein